MSTITVDERIPLKKWLTILGIVGCYLFWSWVGLHVWDFLLFDVWGLDWPLPFGPEWRV